MSRRLDEGTNKNLKQYLSERFGEPLAGAPVRTLSEGQGSCECGGMMDLEGSVCTQCGMMVPHLDVSET